MKCVSISPHARPVARMLVCVCGEELSWELPHLPRRPATDLGQAAGTVGPPLL